MNSRERWSPPALSGGGFKVAAALSAAALLLVVAASSAFGAQDPLKGGTTTLAHLKLPAKVTAKAKGGATKSGKTVALPISGGTLDPTTGSGPVQDGGKIQLQKGSHKATLKGIVTTFGGGSITAKLNGKKVKLGKISGGTVGRAGFGGTVTDAVAKLTKKGAGALNKALGLTHRGFKGGKLSTISTTTVPLTVTVKSATSGTTLDTSEFPFTCAGTGTCTTYVGKLVEDGIAPSYSNGANPGPPLSFTPQTGGNMAPDCTAGTLTGSQGTVTLTKGSRHISQSNPNDDFSGKAVTFEAEGTDVGSLGRAPATTLDVTAGTCVADAANKTITVTAHQAVQPLAAQAGNIALGLDNSACPGKCPLTGGESVGSSTYEIHTQ